MSLTLILIPISLPATTRTRPYYYLHIIDKEQRLKETKKLAVVTQFTVAGPRLKLVTFQPFLIS